MTDAPPAVPRATYRLQFHAGFTFADATAVVPYLDKLGISHVYASPYFMARAGSAHGYDVADHNRLNPEIGSKAEHAAFSARLRGHGMGQILDIVPNHMGIGGADNPWWLDVLEWGPDSPYAGYFDIDWTPSKAALRNKVVVPFLGDHYGRILEAGELVPKVDIAEGTLSVWYWEHRLPIAPADYAPVLGLARSRLKAATEDEAGRLDALITEFRKYRRRPRSAQARVGRRKAAETQKAAFAALLADSAAVRAAVAEALQAIAGAPGDPESFRPLHRILEAQAYRLAYWRVASDEINYRRFFQINDLAAVRTEDARVFEAIHALTLELVADGLIQGLRIDHVDGLFDPKAYLERLDKRLREVRPEGPGGPAPYVVVEKILADHERLRADWPVAGTTGYDAMALIDGVMVDAAGEPVLDKVYGRFVDGAKSFDATAIEAGREVMDFELASELHVLANDLARIAESNWLTRDYTLTTITRALKEVAAHFPVYRAYVARGRSDDDDRRFIEWAVGRARSASPMPDPRIFDFIQAVLTGDLARPRRSGYSRAAVNRFAAKFQQFTAPVHAKAVEDTAFYRYLRLSGLNEVGAEPSRFGTTPPAFHHRMAERAQSWPRAMTATATHDNKRGEDVRARLAVLSEMPAEWAGRARRWASLTRPWKRKVDGARAPSAADEYLLYQTLIGAWPIALLDGEGDFSDFRARVIEYMLKAAREAMVHTAWINQNGPYEEALVAFIERLMDPDRARPVLGDMAEMARRVAWHGMLGGLARAVLKHTVPGVPDLYQGTELWDLSLVDPDNRRPVDFAHRAALLDEIAGADPAALIGDWTDGRIKLFVTRALLRLRAERPALFADGGYRGLEARGEQAERVLAFAREGTDGEIVVVVVPRLTVGLGETGHLPVGRAVWGETVVHLPAAAAGRAFTDALTGRTVAPTGGGDGAVLHVGAALGTLPVAVLAG